MKFIANIGGYCDILRVLALLILSATVLKAAVTTNVKDDDFELKHRTKINIGTLEEAQNLVNRRSEKWLKKYPTKQYPKRENPYQREYHTFVIADKKRWNEIHSGRPDAIHIRGKKNQISNEMVPSITIHNDPISKTTKIYKNQPMYAITLPESKNKQKKTKSVDNRPLHFEGLVTGKERNTAYSFNTNYLANSVLLGPKAASPLKKNNENTKQINNKNASSSFGKNKNNGQRKEKKQGLQNNKGSGSKKY